MNARHTLPALSIGIFLAATAGAASEPTDGHGNEQIPETPLVRPDPSAPLAQHDEVTTNIFTMGPFTAIRKNLVVAGRGMRDVANATTDVWAYGGYAYIGTFNSPCGGDPEAGVWVWDVRNENWPQFVTIIESPPGSRSNDVKVATMNSGDILVHSNEPCADGPGGFEIYDVRDPSYPVHLSSVRIDELNPISDALFGGVTDVGVHNLFLFTQGTNDYVAVVAETAFDNFMLFDITDPSNPQRVAGWGAEEIFDPGVGDVTDLGDPAQVDRVLAAALWLVDGFGGSANRFLHDITVSGDGAHAYLSNWDAGLVLLDISDPADPQLVSVALDPANGSLDAEVNSHAAWPSEDGRIVVETEEDFDAWESAAPPSNLTFGDEQDGDAPLPGTAISTTAGDDFEANPTGNIGTVTGSSVVVTSGPLAGSEYPAIELAGDQPAFPDGGLTGELVFVGRACDGDSILNAGAIAGGGIAVVRRGGCTFREKNFNAAAAGASAIVIANNLTEPTAWGGVRIWDYTDPANPVLASTFNTVCSASTGPGDGCDPNGTYSVHNVIVETTGNRVRAYLSWYWDGMLILDVTDPYNPVEVARYLDTTGPNDGMANDFWGVYKEVGQPWVYGSDRNGGLYVFRELGIGTIRSR